MFVVHTRMYKYVHTNVHACCTQIYEKMLKQNSVHLYGKMFEEMFKQYSVQMYRKMLKQKSVHLYGQMFKHL